MHMIKNGQYSAMIYTSRLFFSWRNTLRMGLFLVKSSSEKCISLLPCFLYPCSSCFIAVLLKGVSVAISIWVEERTILQTLDSSCNSKVSKGLGESQSGSHLSWIGLFFLCLALCNPDVSVSLSWGRWARCLTWVLPVVTVGFVVLYSSKLFYNS